MNRFSTNQAAKKLGIHVDTLAHYVAVGKVPTPEVIIVRDRKIKAGARAVGDSFVLFSLHPARHERIKISGTRPCSEHGSRP